MPEKNRLNFNADRRGCHLEAKFDPKSFDLVQSQLDSRSPRKLIYGKAADIGPVLSYGTVGSQEKFPPTVREEHATSWTISGIVQSQLGIPVPNATVRLVRPGYFKLGDRRST